MFFCNRCGQCLHISDECFTSYAEVSGTETRYLDPGTGEIRDYGDSNVEGNGESTYECPHCSSEDIEPNSEATAEEAFNIRADYEKDRKERKDFLKREEAKAKVSMSEWDLTAN